MATFCIDYIMKLQKKNNMYIKEGKNNMYVYKLRTARNSHYSCL